MKRFLSRIICEKWINAYIVGLFGLLFLSIPLFSYRPKLYLITWAITILILAFMVLNLFFYRFVKITKTHIFLSCFIFTALFASLLTGFSSFSLSPILNTIIILLFYSYFLPQEKTQIRNCVSSLYLGVIVFAFIFAFMYRNSLLSFTTSIERLGSEFGDQNDIAIYFTIGYTLAFHYVFNSKKWYLIIINFLFSLMFVYLSFVGGSKISIIIILIISFVVAGLFFGRKKWYVTILIMVAVTAGIVIVLNIPAFETLKDRFLNMFYSFAGERYKNFNPDYSTAGRLDMMLNGFSLFLRRPLFGFGLNGFMTYSTHHAGWSHNHWSDTLCNYGIVGTFLYHIPFVTFFWNNKDKKSSSYITLVLFIVSTISIALFSEKIFTFFAGLILATKKSDSIWEFNVFNRNKKINKDVNERLKLVEIIPSLNPVGGAETMFVNLCEDIAKNHRDHVDLSIIILYEKKNNFLYERIDKLGINVFCLNKHKGIDLGCAKRVANILNQQKINVIHSHLDTSVTLILTRLFTKKRPIIHTFHHIVGKDGFKKEKLNMQLIRLKQIYPVAVSENASLSIQKETGKKCEYIDNGVALNNFDPTIPVANRKNDFLCVGSFKPVKNQQYLIRVFGKYFLNTSFNLIFLGEGETKQDCMNLVKEVNAKNILFKGAVDNVNEYMSNSKILLIPSISEGNPMVINEAIASGMYIISNNVGGIPNLINHGVNGDLIEFNDFHKFGESMLSRIMDNTFLENRRKDNIKSIQKISISNSVLKYMSIFTSLLANNDKVKVNTYEEN